MDWAQSQGADSLKARFATADALAAQAQTTLTVILAGIGGSAAYAGKLLEPAHASKAAVGFAAACVYLVAVGVVLVFKCMMFLSYPAQFQEPLKLAQRGFGFDELREAELENVSARISEAAAINDWRAYWLNAARVATALTPAVFVVAALSAPPSDPAPALNFTIACAPEAGGASAAAASRALVCKLGR